jgi:hypothetical protein
MPAPWKVVLIGGEITVLAAFTGLGVHLAMQPHRPSLASPPALLLPLSPPPASRPSLAASSRLATSSPSPRSEALSAGWIRRLGQQDHNLVRSQWQILNGLIAGTERYLRDRVLPEIGSKR